MAGRADESDGPSLVPTPSNPKRSLYQVHHALAATSALLRPPLRPAARRARRRHLRRDQRRIHCPLPARQHRRERLHPPQRHCVRRQHPARGRDRRAGSGPGRAAAAHAQPRGRAHGARAWALHVHHGPRPRPRVRLPHVRRRLHRLQGRRDADDDPDHAL
eukprot:2088396-Prymnesium_polylepis.1